MKPNANNTKRLHLHPLMWVVFGLALFSALIFLTALFIPPQGEVHASVLKGLAIQTTNIALVIFAYSVVSGKTATFEHGKTKATVGAPAETAD